VKRYLAEPGSEMVRDAMSAAPAWFTCRIAFVEVLRAVGRASTPAVTRRARAEWPSFGVVEVDQPLVEAAAELALAHGLRSLDAIHLAAATVLPRESLTLATWDARLHAAAVAKGIAVLPEKMPES
jgi:predicted nucleic acid-binding protein